MDYIRYTKAIKNGNREVFKEYMEVSINTIYDLVFKIITCRDTSSDIVQETFIRVWEKRSGLRNDKSLLNWTKKIAVNKCYDYLRKQKRLKLVSDEKELASVISGFQADDGINDSEYQLIVNALTDKLSPKQKMVFTLAEVEKLGADEISELTGMTKTSIKSNLYHARKSVQKKAERILP